MSRIIKLLTATTLISAVSFTAFADNPLVEKADTNNDGLIQWSEFSALSDQKFSEMDADANGLVTKQERKVFREQMRDKRARERFAKTDSNGDGFISKEEFEAARAAQKHRRMERRDLNDDGQLDKQDRQMRKEMRKQIRQHMRQRHNIDANGDGAVDLAEHQAATRDRFEHMDKNGDGILTADEQQVLNHRGKHRMRR